MNRSLGFAVVCVLLSAADSLRAQESDPRQEFLRFIKAQAAQLRASETLPATLNEWQARRKELGRRLQEAWGPFLERPCPLEPRVLGTIQRDGYRIQKILFQTMPGVWMTANAYVPAGPGKHPAILMVHGHWRGARLDPVVQSRCLGAVKLGFFVLAVDAFGAGERAIGKKLGEYHGEMVAAALLPVGRPLSGIQVYENMRAVDYLQSRPEVDGQHIGITGASGGGNQTMYAGSWDDRFRAVVPVCSVGTYDAYLGTACCMCEVVPGALRFAEEWAILARTAPRGLMAINATRDAFQFSVGEAKKSLRKAGAVYGLFDRPLHIRHTVFDWQHDYSKEMREAMYGWMTLHLKREGNGKPIPEPPIKTEDPEALRCFPGDSRPAEWMTIPRFAAEQSRRLLAARRPPSTREEWAVEARGRDSTLINKVFGGFPDRRPLKFTAQGNSSERQRVITFDPEPGITLTATQSLPMGSNKAKLAILLDLEGAARARNAVVFKELQEAGWNVITLDLRVTGKLAWSTDAIGRAKDHNSAEWSLWIGRPLLGQWTLDVMRLLDTLAREDREFPKDVAVLGLGSAGLVALCAGAIDERITRVAAVDCLASYVTEVPYQGQRLGVIAPGILRDVGDVQHLVALCAPKHCIIAGGVHGGGDAVTTAERHRAFEFAGHVYRLLGAVDELQLIPVNETQQVVRSLR